MLEGFAGALVLSRCVGQGEPSPRQDLRIRSMPLGSTPHASNDAQLDGLAEARQGVAEGNELVGHVALKPTSAMARAIAL